MTTVGQIGWGTYKGYEGPLFWGKAGVTVSERPTDEEKVLLVVTATEGGKWDAVNMYDRMIVSVGAIQWGEAGQYSVSDMLGKVAQRSPELLGPLQPALDRARAQLKLNPKGRYRFFTPTYLEVDTLAEQQGLFLLRSNGGLGSWDEESKAYAKVWAAALSSVFQQPEAQKAQADFTTPKLRSYFVVRDAQAVLWGADEKLPNTGWVGAIRAAFISFAANLPAVAAEQLKKAPLAGLRKWSPEWCIALLRQLTFGPGITIYPHRYEKIRPVLEAQYGVDLPDFAKDLQAWQLQHGIDPGAKAPTFTTVLEIQTELLAQGFDIGPAGADGRMGAKTTDAVRTFQRLRGLGADGIVGPQTRAAFVAEWTARNG